MSEPADFLSVLRARTTPVLKAGTAHLPGAGYAWLAKDGQKATYADPLSEKVASDDAKMTHRFRISTPCVDRVGDVVLPRGCERYLERYSKNPQVLFGHDSNAFPVARSLGAGGFGVDIDDAGLYGTAEFHGKTYESEKCYELIKLGYLNATSIGFRPLKATLMPDNREKGDRQVLDFDYPGLCFQEWELMEWSVVPIPANPEALDGMKSWLGKASGAESPLVQSIKAMLAADNGKSVTVTVPAAPPATDPTAGGGPTAPPAVSPETPPPVTKTAAAPFTDAEVDRALAALGAGLTTATEVRRLADENKALRARLDALEQKLAAPPAGVPPLEPAPVPAAKELPPVPAEPPPPAPESPGEPDGGEPCGPKKQPPVGAWVLLEGKRAVDELYHLIEAKLPQVDNPKTCDFLDGLHADLDGLMGKIQKFGRKQYPDWFPKDAGDKAADPTDRAVEPGPKAVGPSPAPPAPPAPPAQPTWDPALLAQLADQVRRLELARAAAARNEYRLTGRRA